MAQPPDDAPTQVEDDVTPETRRADELAWLPAWRVRELIISREISPVEVIESSLRRIERMEPSLHSFITVAAERALSEARKAERELVAGNEVGPLFGIPIAVKDEIWTQGIRSTAGSLIFKDFVPDADGVVADRLRRSGAIIVGKNNMPEFASFPRSKNQIVPESVNPWDASRISGASSGGSTASVAAGMVPVAVGSDGGGSIRIPAALCGVIGLYPTVGRVPARGSFSYSPLASMGPIARDVRDAATLLQVISGPDAEDSTCRRDMPPDYLGEIDAGVRGLRIAFVPGFSHAKPTSAVLDAVTKAAFALEECGAVVEAPDFVFDDVWYAFQAVRNGRVLYEDIPAPFTQSEDFRSELDDPAMQQLLCRYNQGRTRKVVSESDWIQGLHTRAALIEKLDSLYERFAVIVTPTMPDVAPAAIEGWDSPYPDHYHGTYYTAMVNLVGATAASYPCGLDRGLPIGIQVIARPGDESTILRVLRALETVRPWTEHPRLLGD